MKTLTVMMIAYNEFEWIEAAIDSIRMMADIDNVELIVVDNHSEDGLREWAAGQQDFTYVYMDEGMKGYGKIINEVRRELNLNGDLLIMEGHYAITPGFLSRLLNVLDQEEKVGAVGGISNHFRYQQKLPDDSKESYEAALKYASGLKLNRAQRVMGLYPNVILFSSEVLNLLGDFEEEVFGLSYVMRDYIIRMIQSEYKIMICREAVFWDIPGKKVYPLYMNRFRNIDDEKYLENKWGMHYFNFFYKESVLSLFNKYKNAEFSVLEVGCGCGATLLEIKNRYPNVHLYGTDLNAKSVEMAAHFAEACVNNIEEKNLPYPEKSFDYIIFADVLEHLHNPEETLIYCQKYLKRNGCILASIPNIMHISVMEQLLRGDFTYTEMGLLDRTHIHFFTWNEIKKMFTNCNYAIQKVICGGISITERQRNLIEQLYALDKRGEKYMYDTFQYLIRAKSL